jgi:pilus assembly protein CpaB
MQRKGTAMRREVVLALGLASISGIFAVMGINEWMSSEYARLMRSQEPAKPTVEMASVVVAKEELAFGVAATREKLQEVEWPAKNVPRGAFKTIDEFLKQQDTRIVLEPMAADEPVLNGKVTGPGQRSGLATMLEPGKKAVTIRINDVVGVGGLVLPGDRVDIFVTNEAKNLKNKDGSDVQPYTDLLLKNVRVLAVDQILDPKHTAPILGRTVTVEATLADAQKITLASTIGSLSLVLRENSPASAAEVSSRLSLADLSGNSGDNSTHGTLEPAIAVASEAKAVAPGEATKREDLAKVSVVRATASTEYSVLRRGMSE